MLTCRRLIGSKLCESNSTQGGLRPFFGFLLVFSGFLFLPNILIYLLSDYYGLVRPYLNIDYALSVVLFAFGRKVVGGFFVMFFLLIDMLSLAGQLFPFVRFQDVFYFLSFILLAPAYYKFLLGVGLLLFGFGIYVHVLLGKRLSRVDSLVSFNVVIFSYLLMPYALGDNDTGSYRRVAENPLSSQSVYFITHRLAGFSSNFHREGDPLLVYRGKSASDIWLEEMEKGEIGDQLLLIVVESWGVPKEKEIQAEILGPLYELNYIEVQSGEISFSGSTVAGELRELCRLYPEHYNLKNLTEGFENCLPRVLQSEGFITVAQHGAMSTMYDRRFWYPRAGFEEFVSFEARDWPRRCYSFPGACDVDMMAEVSSFFSNNEKGFFYWLTLNSHSLYDERDIFIDRFDCEKFGVGEGESCRNLKLHAQFFYELASLLDDEAMKGVDVLVVSDHQPRVLDINEFGAVFEAEKIPWIRMTQNDNGK
ncbi:hypothetical protein QLQ85_10735 [Halomonas sp. M4R5S39]|uniref:sulfatase-like hydrolase/transferase n=1 Tax=Halomonas kalidii TaxID=3043293 RepID=UPI0024A8D235|nr:sulfatase-like hydrolase/transferase [Halomonas kalidii]MDI5985270.1 hypothetical protein [Halomonas kalidii]